ncbi:MAG: hypothetical protein CL940_04885 [Deltaproteobacteria bacterium]|nr:hypothetical protein [Deltaproteobacteria bacterium]
MPTKTENTVDRRSFLAASAAGAVALTSVPNAIAHVNGPTLKVGSSLGSGWTLTDINGPEAGAIRLVAGHEATGRRANISVCRAEAGSGALASTGLVDVFLMNDGRDGKVRTPSDEVALVGRIARTIQGREESIPGAARLLGRRERQAAFNPIDHLEPLEQQ